MTGERKNPLSRLRRINILYPVIIGLGFIGFMLYRNFDPKIFSDLTIGVKGIFWLVFAFMLMGMRDFGYMARLKILSDNQFTWLQTFRIVMLWEFTSAITPSAIGGTTVAVVFMNKEGISLGKSTAIVMATSLLDELYFLAIFPLLLVLIKTDALFSIGGDHSGTSSFVNQFLWLALIGYSLKFLYAIALIYGLFINPGGLKLVLLWIFKLPLIRRWRAEANVAGNEVVTASKELRSRSFSFWIRAFLSTCFSWTSRYWIVNALFLIFFVIPDHLLLYARQLIAWIMMLVIPTPGGSGGAEWLFTEFLGDLIPHSDEGKASYAIILAFMWRLISYYPYLVIGTIILPRWIRKKFVSKQDENRAKI